MRYGVLLIVAVALLLGFTCERNADGGDAPVAAVNLDKLNTAADEEDPCPTADGFTLLYASKALGSYDIYKSTRLLLSRPFGPGKPFIADKVADERAPFLYKDKYYFCTNEVPDPKFAKLKNFDILWQIGFQRPLPLLGEINTSADELYPWISPSGKELYFSRKTMDGWKLMVADGPVPGPIGNAREVGFPLHFHRATIGGKGLTMFLQGPLVNGKTGIFRSTRAKLTDRWSRAEALHALNHPESRKGDMQPAMSFDGARLYFVSDRPGGKGGLDIWMVQTAMLK